jgi:hypothetical protein
VGKVLDRVPVDNAKVRVGMVLGLDGMVEPIFPEL